MACAIAAQLAGTFVAPIRSSLARVSPTDSAVFCDNDETSFTKTRQDNAFFGLFGVTYMASNYNFGSQGVGTFHHYLTVNCGIPEHEVASRVYREARWERPK